MMLSGRTIGFWVGPDSLALGRSGDLERVN